MYTLLRLLLLPLCLTNSHNIYYFLSNDNDFFNYCSPIKDIRPLAIAAARGPPPQGRAHRAATRNSISRNSTSTSQRMTGTRSLSTLPSCEVPARMIETRDSHELLVVVGIPDRTAIRHATRQESRSERARSCSTQRVMSPNPIGKPTRRLPAQMEVIGNPTPRDPPTTATEKHVNVVGMIMLRRTLPKGRCMCRL